MLKDQENKLTLSSETKENKSKEEIPKSPKAKLKYKDYLELIEYYKKRILKQSSSLCQNDMKVIHDLLIETIEYITLLSPILELNKEREQLFSIAINIIDHLSTLFKNQTTPSYQIKMKVKLYETKFNFYFRQVKDFDQAEIVLNEIIKIQQEHNFPMFNQASTLFFAALIRFQLNDINSAEVIAKRSLDILENKIYFDANEDKGEERKTKEDKEFEGKKIEKISNILDFLAEIYLLQKNLNSAISCIENAYYLNLGHHGIEYIDTIRYSDQLEKYRQQRILYQEDLEGYEYMEDFKNRKIAQGNIRVFSGTGINYSFKVPYTNSTEPYLISLYKNSKNKDKDKDKKKFDSSLFMTNLYLDKNDLYKYLRIPEQFRENYLLYTDENMNMIFEHINVDDKFNYSIDDPKLIYIVFSSFSPKA